MSGSTLRVGLVVPRFTPFRGGVETYTAQAASALASKGAEVTVITQMPRDAGLPLRVALDGYNVERHSLPFRDSFDVPSPAAVRSAWRPCRFDIVWVHSYHTPLAWLVSEQAKAPVVLTPHYHGGGHTRLREGIHYAYRPLGRRLMAASSLIAVDTDAEASQVLRDFPRHVHRDKIRVIPLAVVDPVRGQRPYLCDSPVVLTVARQEPYKRTDLLIRAVVELRNRAVPARLVVVGEGSELKTLQQLAVRLRAQDVVRFIGRADEETLARWWASASLYATASRHEAFGIGLAEALVAGLPVVASGIPAHREVVRRAGSSALAALCPADISDVDATSQYADLMSQLLASPGSSSERAARCALPTTAHMADQLFEMLISVRG
ncbi:glycosyltransferase family 4 protein [Rhodococcus pyridinivorans]|nr:glycosyltransferase family 4 protein [Rhodococcus pyridinivorans]